GVFVRPDGVVVTNNHVIKGASDLTIVLPDRREFAATILLQDERTDLAVLKIDAGGERFAALEFADSDQAEVGDVVLAIGNPFGVGQTVTSGIVSALARTQVGVSDYQFFIQTDAAINPGNSGGALVDGRGALIGVNTAIFTRSGGSNGIGFAIPSNMVARVVDAALSGGRLVRPWIGVTGQDVTSDLAESLGLDRPGAVLIASVFPGGPGAKAGLTRGDVVLRADGFEVTDRQSLRYRVATVRPGETVDLLVLRNGKERTVSVRTALPPEDPPRNVTELSGAHPLSGAVIGNLSPAFNEELGLDPELTGVVVVDIQRGSATRLSLRPGDIIRTVNGVNIIAITDLQTVLSRPAPAWEIVYRRGNRDIRIAIR
ncbi:MAG: trypsin-like peptidase domain-containing protein, partial [Pseudomonadota bacterium]